MKFQDFSDDWTETTHRKLIDSSVYDTFTAIIPTVRMYCKENENANYQYEITDKGIGVIVKSPKLLFREKDSEVLRILPVASLVKIQFMDELVMLELWFRF